MYVIVLRVSLTGLTCAAGPFVAPLPSTFCFCKETRVLRRAIERQMGKEKATHMKQAALEQAPLCHDSSRALFP